MSEQRPKLPLKYLGPGVMRKVKSGRVRPSVRYPKPGETVMFCPTNRRYTVWRFTEDDALVCTECTRRMTRAEATGKAR